MTESTYRHNWQIGDAVLADFNGAQVPGVIEDTRSGQALVRLADPWIDESGRRNDTMWLPNDRLSTFVNEETGGEQALPKQ